jgi:hypothetical protein
LIAAVRQKRADAVIGEWFWTSTINAAEHRLAAAITQSKRKRRSPSQIFTPNAESGVG